MTCPLCELKNMNINIFYDIVGDPLECSWVLEKDLFSKKITIKAKKCKEIMENNYSVHIRSIKIKGNKYRKFL